MLSFCKELTFRLACDASCLSDERVIFITVKSLLNRFTCDKHNFTGWLDHHSLAAHAAHSQSQAQYLHQPSIWFPTKREVCGGTPSSALQKKGTCCTFDLQLCTAPARDWALGPPPEEAKEEEEERRKGEREGEREIPGGLKD